MGKITKILVCGQAGVGKTSIIEQVIYGRHVIGAPMFLTIEDIYTVVVETDRGIKEKVRVFDTAGLDASKPELPKHCLSFPDGIVLVYDINNWDSFQRIDKVKRDIDRNREKVHIIALGNVTECEPEHRQVDSCTAQLWASKEKVKLFEVELSKRKTLIEAFVWLTSRITQPPSKSSFPIPGRKAKSANLDM